MLASVYAFGAATSTTETDTANVEDALVAGAAGASTPSEYANSVTTPEPLAVAGDRVVLRLHLPQQQPHGLVRAPIQVRQPDGDRRGTL